MSALKRQNDTSPPQTCKATRTCGPTPWRRDPLFIQFDRTVQAAESTRVVAGYLERDTQECTPLGETLTVKQRMRVVGFIADLVDDLGLRKPTALLAINYFDRWFSKVCVDKHAKKDRIDRSWNLHVTVVTRMLSTRMDSAYCASHVMSLISKPVPTEDEVRRRTTNMWRTLQLASSACLLMAAKFEDVKMIPLSELVDVCECCSTSNPELADLELNILDVLDWQLNAKTPYNYVYDLAGFCEVTLLDDFKDTVEYYIDNSPYCYDLLKFHPAVVASACLLKAWQDEPIDQITFKGYLRILAHACAAPCDQLRHAQEILDDGFPARWSS